MAKNSCVAKTAVAKTAWQKQHGKNSFQKQLCVTRQKQQGKNSWQKQLCVNGL